MPELIVPLTGGCPAPTLITTLRRTTTPSAGLETCTGDRLSTVGWTTTTGLGAILGGAGAGAAGGGNSCPTEAGSNAIGSNARGSGATCTTGATGSPGAGTAGTTGAATSTITGAAGLASIAGSPRAVKKAEMRASCSRCVSSLIIALCSFCIAARTASSGDAGSYSCFFEERIVPS